MTGRVLRDSFPGNVSVMRQVGPHEVVPVAVPCLIGVTLDVDQHMASQHPEFTPLDEEAISG